VNSYKKIVLALGLLCWAGGLPTLASASDHSEAVSLDFSEIPANDLVYQSRVLNPEEAWDLEKNQHLDLSALDPDTSGDLWKNYPVGSDPDDVPIMDLTLDIPDGSVPEFLGTIASREGTLRFNLKTAGANSHWVTAMLGTTAHTSLLQRALLVRLGYVVPAMKFYPKLTVHFPDLAAKTLF